MGSWRGVLFGGRKQVIPIVWFYEWSQTIRDRFWSATDKTGSLLISDLELTGTLLQWLVFEHLVAPLTLRDTSDSIWCDNLPAVAWMYKFRTSLFVKHISGIYNTMVSTMQHFLADFSALFPPPQDKYWTLFLLRNKSRTLPQLIII
jgi:hypothetical protein